MHQTKEKISHKKLVGITCRTSYQTQCVVDTEKNPIAATVMHYFHNAIFNEIPHRKMPGVTYCAYTDYESDYTGEYTYFIGEEVTNIDDLPEGFESLTIPEQEYVKFTNEPGPMPQVCIQMWEQIWKLEPTNLGGSRSYKVDFEIYDERSLDHQNVVLDIFIGIEKEDAQ